VEEMPLLVTDEVNDDVCSLGGVDDEDEVEITVLVDDEVPLEVDEDVFFVVGDEGGVEDVTTVIVAPEEEVVLEDDMV
jgi:hypothetical protein